MKLAIGILSIATMIFWIMIIIFSVTAVYSVTKLVVSFGEVEMLPSSQGITFSVPFSINNDGYYELADLNLTTCVTDPDGTILDQSETFIPSIPPGTNVNETHKVLINLDTLMSIDYIPLLLNDSSFEVEFFGSLNFARVVPVQLSTNTTISWGAPFAHFSVGRISVSSHNRTHGEVSIPVSFENHAILDLKGTLKLEFYSDPQEQIAFGQTDINVPSQQSYNDIINAYPREQDISRISSSGDVHVIFETPAFVVDWWEPYG